MAVMELWRRRDLEGAVKTEYIDGNFFTQDSVGNLVGVKVYKDGAEATLTGSVTGYCVLPSGETVSVAGTRSGNQASILVPQSALAYTGPLGITLKLIDGNTITTLMSIIVVVYRSKTDTVITPSSQIITDWSNQISAALQEVEDASVAQDEKIDDLKSAIVNVSDAFIAGNDLAVVGTDYVGVRLNPNTGAVATDTVAARTKVFPISPGATITAKVEYDANSINRFGIGLSNNAVPQSGDTPAVIELGNKVISATTSKSFTNTSNYKYCYIYYWTVAGGAAYNGNSALVTLSEHNAMQQKVTETEMKIVGLLESCSVISGFQTGVIQDDQTYDGATNRASSAIFASNGGCALFNFMESDGYEYNVRCWNADKSEAYLLYSDWTTERKKTVDAPYFAVFFRKSSNAAISDAEVANLRIGVYTPIGYSTVANYRGMRLSILGDSISTYGGNVSTSASDDPRYADGTWTYAGNKIRYPQGNLLTSVEDMYWKKVMNKTGMVFGVNDSIAGALCSWDGTTESDTEGADKHAASMTRIGHLGGNGTPDIILVNVGTNDQGGNVDIGPETDTRVLPTWYDFYGTPENYTQAQIEALPVRTFKDAYRTMLVRLMWMYPSAKIICMTINFRKSTRLDKTDTYNEAIKDVCDLLGVPLVDTRHSGISVFELATYYGDTTHYNANGMKFVADILLKALFYGV